MSQYLDEAALAECRKAFEVECHKEQLDTLMGKSNGEWRYCEYGVQQRWIGWQAAWNARPTRGGLLDPDMPTQELRLHMGELTAGEVRSVHSAIRWANTRVCPTREAAGDVGDSLAEMLEDASCETKGPEDKLFAICVKASDALFELINNPTEAPIAWSRYEAAKLLEKHFSALPALREMSEQRAVEIMAEAIKERVAFAGSESLAVAACRALTQQATISEKAE